MGVKLIEVALPLDEINKASAREKSIRHGHPSTLHLWWARRPLAAARAVLFASIVDDPSSPEYRWKDGLTIARTPEAIDAERQRLHDLIVELVQWENSNNEKVLGKAKAEIMRATDGNPPPVLDPFAGGGSIPLEAQRLGLEAHASDLNPVAVLINKALIEIPPKFAGMPPVNPVDRAKGMGAQWKGAAGLAADVRYYGQWMRNEAEKRIGHLYPKATLPDGSEATVIVWLWARTVTCPNPACGAQMPLVSSFWLSKKPGKETYVEPRVNLESRSVEFTIKMGKTGVLPETVTRRGASCLFCDSAVPFSYLRSEGKANRMSQIPLAIVVEGKGKRAYLAPDELHRSVAFSQSPDWIPDGQISHWPGRTNVVEYGMTDFYQLFTDRQLVALTTFSDLVSEASDRAMADAILSNIINKNDATDVAMAYREAIATYLAFLVSKQADLGNSLNRWEPVAQCPRQLFARQAIPMVWDFAEGNPLGNSSGSWNVLLRNLDGVLQSPLMGHQRDFDGYAVQVDAAVGLPTIGRTLISTDPPYYDNIGYADLSDFFYVWLRRSLGSLYPDLFKTMLVPKTEELVATPYRFNGSKEQANQFFEQGLQKTFRAIRASTSSDFPVTIYYAFKQSEGEQAPLDTHHSSTGWETMLTGLMESGFSITGTWPMRTEMGTRMIGQGTNALASSIVLACRVRDEDAPTIARNEFQRRLRRELPTALRTMQQSSIAPVDLAQAAIGPGMKIYSEYSGVLEPNGDKMRVRTALQLINQVLDETLSEQDADYDRETGWAITWFEQYEMKEAEFGRADDLARARNTSVEGLVSAGIVRSGRGKVQLIARKDMPDDWNPERDRRLTDWEAAQHLIKRLEQGQEKAAQLKRQLGGRAEVAKELAYRLYVICERKGWSQEALAYNGLVVSWPEIEKLERELPGTVTQTSF